MNSQSNVFIEVNNFFSQLFTTSYPSIIEEVLAFVQSRVTMNMNEELVANISIEEVRYALFQIHPLKALGLDGLLALFYQRY